MFYTLNLPSDASLDLVIRRLLPPQSFYHPLVLLLDQVVQCGRPLADAADVKSELVVDLGCGADRERMPLVRINGRNLYEDPIASTEVEARRSLDDEVGHLGGENDSCLDSCIPCPNAHLDQSYGHLNQPDQSRHDDPAPVRRSMEDKKGEEGPVEEVGEVEHMEVS